MCTRIILLSLFLLMSGQSAAQQSDAPLNERQIKHITVNVNANLQHPCDDVIAGSLQLLIDLSATHPEVPLDFALLPVMAIFRGHAEEGMRMLAAVALQRIGGERAHYAVGRRALYEDSPRVARLCRRLCCFWECEPGETGSFASR